MSKKTVKKTKVVKEVELVIKKKVAKPIVKPEPTLKEIETKYNKMVEEIRPKLLTVSQLKRGGSGIRSRYAIEKGYEIVLPELNELGKKLGKAPIGLGNLRKN